MLFEPLDLCSTRRAEHNRRSLAHAVTVSGHHQLRWPSRPSGCGKWPRASRRRWILTGPPQLRGHFPPEPTGRRLGRKALHRRWANCQEVPELQLGVAVQPQAINIDLCAFDYAFGGPRCTKLHAQRGRHPQAAQAWASVVTGEANGGGQAQAFRGGPVAIVCRPLRSAITEGGRACTLSATTRRSAHVRGSVAADEASPPSLHLAGIRTLAAKDRLPRVAEGQVLRLSPFGWG